MTTHERFMPKPGTTARAVAEAVDQVSGTVGLNPETFKGFNLLQAGLSAAAVDCALAELEAEFGAIHSRYTAALGKQGALRVPLRQILLTAHPTMVARCESIDGMTVDPATMSVEGSRLVAVAPKNTGRMMYVARDSIDIGSIAERSQLDVGTDQALSLGKRTCYLDTVDVIDLINGNKQLIVTSHDFEDDDSVKVSDIYCIG